MVNLKLAAILVMAQERKKLEAGERGVMLAKYPADVKPIIHMLLSGRW